MLFASDEDLVALQRQVSRVKKGEVVSSGELRREAIDDARELRAHIRARQFAYLLFVAPVLVAVAVAIAQAAVTWWFAKR